ncbi:MAG: hypothetical protein ACLUVC_04385 [Longibaculum sp.]
MILNVSTSYNIATNKMYVTFNASYTMKGILYPILQIFPQSFGFGSYNYSAKVSV